MSFFRRLNVRTPIERNIDGDVEIIMSGHNFRKICSQRCWIQIPVQIYTLSFQSKIAISETNCTGFFQPSFDIYNGYHFLVGSINSEPREKIEIIITDDAIVYMKNGLFKTDRFIICD